jgi:hypothetical protein
MDKKEIIEALEELIYICELNENLFMKTKLSRIMTSLINEWNESDVYFSQIQDALN